MQRAILRKGILLNFSRDLILRNIEESQYVYCVSGALGTGRRKPDTFPVDQTPFLASSTYLQFSPLHNPMRGGSIMIVPKLLMRKLRHTDV